MQKWISAMRRSGLLMLCIGLLGLSGLTGCGKHKAASADGDQQAEQQRFQWKLVTTWPKHFPGLGTAPENFAKLVNEMSDGRLTVKVYGAKELVPAMEVFDTVSRGAAEMGHGAAYYWKGKAPAAQLFTVMPFGLNAQEMNSWIHFGGGLELWRELYSQYNLVPFAGGNTGVQMAGWFNKEINSLADLKGLKMRIPGLAGEVIQRVGAVPVNLPGGEIFTALQTGAIDATEWVGPYNDMAFGLHKAAKYYYYPGWHEPGSMLEFIINKDKWNQLPKDLQAIVSVAMRAINQEVMDEFTARNSQALKELQEKHRVELRPLPEDVLIALRKASKEVITENMAKEPMTKKVYESMKAFAEQVKPYIEISEEAYLHTRKL